MDASYTQKVRKLTTANSKKAAAARKAYHDAVTEARKVRDAAIAAADTETAEAIKKLSA